MCVLPHINNLQQAKISIVLSAQHIAYHVTVNFVSLNAGVHKGWYLLACDRTESHDALSSAFRVGAGFYNCGRITAYEAHGGPASVASCKIWLLWAKEKIEGRCERYHANFTIGALRCPRAPSTFVMYGAAYCGAISVSHKSCVFELHDANVHYIVGNSIETRLVCVGPA